MSLNEKLLLLLLGFNLVGLAKFFWTWISDRRQITENKKDIGVLKSKISNMDEELKDKVTVTDYEADQIQRSIENEKIENAVKEVFSVSVANRVKLEKIITLLTGDLTND